MSPADPDVTPDAPPADPPAAPPADPPAAPEPPAPPAAPSRSDDDRMSALETMVGNLTETVGSLVDAIAGNGHEPEVQPQKVPWLYRGGRKRGE